MNDSTRKSRSKIKFINNSITLLFSIALSEYSLLFIVKLYTLLTATGLEPTTT